MATTTNYSWTTPDDTALVKDGAAAIRSLGTSVDTTTKALNPSTTLGDIEYRSSTANTNTRVGIGTTGQVLTVAGGVPSWATPSSGGMTLLSTTTVSSTSTTVSSIDQTYVNLYIEWFGVTNDTSDAGFAVSTNLTSALSFQRIVDGYTVEGTYLQTTISPINNRVEAIKRTGGKNYHTMLINNYASSTSYKTFSIFGCYEGSSNNGRILLFTGGAASTTAINSFTLACNSSQNMTAGTIKIYGVK